MTKASYVRSEAARGQTRHHECHARGCQKQVPPAFLMCGKHWGMVPKKIQADVWRHYQPGQEKGASGVTDAYLLAAQAAIEAVAAKEDENSKQKGLFK